eukprot:g30070.t1
MIGDRKVVVFVAHRAQVLYKVVSEPSFGLTNVEEATLGAADAVDRVDGCAVEPMSDVEDLNDLDVTNGGIVSKFVDDSKIGGVVDSEEGYLRIQQDLDQMGRWAEEWHTEFNLDNCEVQHSGKANQSRTYTPN